MRAKSRNLTLTDALDRDLPRIWADERAVRQVTLNLLTNAIKFTPQGGSIVVKVGWTGAGGQYVSIKDTGPGIPPEEIPVVLSSFGRGSLAQKNAEEGTGLGLPIVKGLVELHGGQFRLTSKLRQGTEAVVIFPPERTMDAQPATGPGVAAGSSRAARPAARPQTARLRAGGVSYRAGLFAEARRLDGEMRLVLKARVLAFDKKRRGVRDRAANRRDPSRLGFREIAQDEVVHERLVAGMADAQTHASVVVADMGADRTQAIVAGVSAADFDPDLRRRKVEFVMNDDKRGAVEFVKAERFADAAAGFVHEGLRGEQHDALAADHALRRQSGKARAERTDAMRLGDRLERHEADVVSVARVALARIAESRDDEHGAPDRSRTASCGRRTLSRRDGRGRCALLLGRRSLRLGLGRRGGCGGRSGAEPQPSRPSRPASRRP